ncbi:hypothetical protein GCM10009775_18700 [Microbacterium aoyamense]|uniref:Cell wall binding repeat 2 n=1 Tax=Microbacterium aoyamense TaxID=344166 RepID=A0ABP5B205_9MICO|nr:cell wall-binding repeat-containing protein [Microbacterium aoyamense]
MSRIAVGRSAPGRSLRRILGAVAALATILVGTVALPVAAQSAETASVVYRSAAQGVVWPKVSNVVITGTATGFDLAFDWQQPAQSDSCPGGPGSQGCWTSVTVQPELGVYRGTFAENPTADDFDRGYGMNGGDFPIQTIETGASATVRTGHYSGSFTFDRSDDLTVMLIGSVAMGDSWSGAALFLAAAELPPVVTPGLVLNSNFGTPVCTPGGAEVTVKAGSGGGPGRAGVVAHIAVWYDTDMDGQQDAGESVETYSGPLETVTTFAKTIPVEREGITDVTVNFTDPAISQTQTIYAGDRQYFFPRRCEASPVQRWSGPGRYDTAVKISQEAFPSGADVVFIANGTAFPDALAGAPVAGKDGGPVLLTPSGALPPAVKAEVARLDPSKIVVLGGSGAVGPAVVSELEGIAPVERWSGPGRYDTAVAISQKAFPTRADVVFIANGTAFPDALAGAPVAGKDEGPVLLTPSGALPPAVKAEVARLDPSKIVVLGGSGAVGPAVVSELEGIAPVDRWSGPGRYDTAVAISKKAFPTGADVVFIANGTTFPDALAGAPVAGMQAGPVLLTPAGALPPAVQAEVFRLGPERVVVLGGNGAVSPAVIDALELAIP